MPFRADIIMSQKVAFQCKTKNAHILVVYYSRIKAKILLGTAEFNEPKILNSHVLSCKAPWGEGANGQQSPKINDTKMEREIFRWQRLRTSFVELKPVVWTGQIRCVHINLSWAQRGAVCKTAAARYCCQRGFYDHTNAKLAQLSRVLRLSKTCADFRIWFWITQNSNTVVKLFKVNMYSELAVALELCWHVWRVTSRTVFVQT